MKSFSAMAAAAVAALSLSAPAHAAVTLEAGFNGLNLYNWQDWTFDLTPYLEIGGVQQKITGASIKVTATSLADYRYDGETTNVRQEDVMDDQGVITIYDIDERIAHYRDAADTLTVSIGPDTFEGSTPQAKTAVEGAFDAYDECWAPRPSGCMVSYVYSYKNQIEYSGYNGDLTLERSLSASALEAMQLGSLYLRFDAPSGAFDYGNLILTFTTETVDQGGGPVGAVPEPASWALMIAGFGLAGAAMRRRRSLAI